MKCDEEKTSSILMTHNTKERQEQCCPKVRFVQARKPCSRQPDGPYAYFVCFCGFVCMILASGCTYGYGILFPALLDEFREGKGKTAWIGSLAYASGSLFAPLMGYLCGRFNHRTVGFGGGLISTLALLATSQAPNLTVMYFTFGLAFGIGGYCLLFVVLTITPRYFVKRSALATGIVLMGPIGSLIVMAPIIQALLNITTWRITLIAMAGMMLPTCLLSCSFDSNAGNQECELANERSDGSHFCSRFDFSYLRNKEYVIYLTACVSSFCAITVPFVHMARYCQERGIDANRASMMYLYNGVASLILRLLTGYLCDNNKIHPKFILQAGLFLAGVTCALITLRPSYVHLLVCFIVYGAADGAVVSSMNILALSTLPPHQRTQGFAFWHFCISFSLITGPPFGGFLADLSGSYSLTLYVAGFFHILACCIIFLSYCIQHPKVTRETLSDLIPTENFLIVEKVTVL